MLKCIFLYTTIAELLLTDTIVQSVRTNMEFNISMMRKNSQMRIISRSKRPPAAYLLVAVERASTLFSILAFHQLMDRGAWARGPMRI